MYGYKYNKYISKFVIMLSITLYQESILRRKKKKRKKKEKISGKEKKKGKKWKKEKKDGAYLEVYERISNELFANHNMSPSERNNFTQVTLSILLHI